MVPTIHSTLSRVISAPSYHLAFLSKDLVSKTTGAFPLDELLEHEPSFRFSLPIDWLVHSIHKRHVEMVVEEVCA